MTQEEIETILNENLPLYMINEDAVINDEEIKSAAKLILASHLRSQIQLVEHNISKLKINQMRFLSDSVADKYTWQGLSLAHSELNVHKSILSEKLSKLNQ